VTDRSGAGPIELATLLDVGAAAGARPGQYISCVGVLPVIEEHTGLGPRYAYEALLDMARPWVIAVPLITVQGNMGDRDFPASEPRYLECQPSHAGQAVLDAEAGRRAPVPAGLINGTTYRGGTQPPLEPSRVIAALRHLLDHPHTPDYEIIDLAGPPYSVTGCTVTGDLDALNAGQRITLRQTGRITRTSRRVPETVPDSRPGPPAHAVITQGDGHDHYAWTSTGPDERHVSLAHLIIESLPPGVAPGRVCSDLGSHQRAIVRPARDGRHRHADTLPLGDVYDASTSRDPIRIAITLLPGTNPDTARDEIGALDGITTEEPAAYPAPLATLLRTWTDQHRSEDIAASLTTLQHAIHHDQQHQDD
jgi:hypothetical protein